MKLSELITNDDGRLSTTNFIQIISAITLNICLIIAVFFQSPIAEWLAVTLAGVATLTPASKGIVGYKRDKEIKHDSE